MIYWFVGQPGTGKSTLARMLKNHFDSVNRPSIHLDGDDLRVIFGGTYKTEHFTKEYRDTNTRKLQAFVEHIENQGVDVIVSTVNGNRTIREELKSRNPRVIEIYVMNSAPHVREDRAYSDFEVPIDNCVVMDTGAYSSPEATFLILLEKLYHEEKIRMEAESSAVSHKKDKRYNKHLKQLKTCGFSDSETWSLYSNIAKFILPRLIRFRKIIQNNPYGGYPLGLTEQMWDDMLGEMIFAFDWSITCDEKSFKMTKEETTAAWERYKKGMQLFSEWFQGLWW